MATDTAPATETAEAPTTAPEASADGAQTTAEQPAAEGEKPKRQLNGVYVSTPKELRDKLEEEATRTNQTVAGMVRNMLAARYQLELPPVQAVARKKYANADERKAAQRAQRQDRNALVKMLLERHKAELKASAEAAAASA